MTSWNKIYTQTNIKETLFSGQGYSMALASKKQLAIRPSTFTFKIFLEWRVRHVKTRTLHSLSIKQKGKVGPLSWAFFVLPGPINNLFHSLSDIEILPDHFIGGIWLVWVT